MKDITTFADWVKMRRSELKLTQQQLAVETGLGRTYINNIERGRIHFPQAETRNKFHRVFGSSETELEEYGIITWDDYSNAWIPTYPVDPEPHAAKILTSMPVEIEGLPRLKGGPYALLGAALVYAFKAMSDDQRSEVLALLIKIDGEQRVEIDDVPF